MRVCRLWFVVVAQGEVLDDVELGDNEAAFSIATVVFHDRGGEVFLVVGTAQDMLLHPRTLKCGYIHVYRFLEGKRLQLLHKTKVADVPYALCEFKGRLAASVGRLLRIYDLGLRKLLKKCESKSMPTFVASIQVNASRLYVSDMAESVHLFKYNPKANSLMHFADDLVPRYTTAVLPLDYDTVAIADKFGNIAVLRLPPDISDDVDNPTGDRLLWETGVLNGAPNKVRATVLLCCRTPACVCCRAPVDAVVVWVWVWALVWFAVAANLSVPCG